MTISTRNGQTAVGGGRMSSRHTDRPCGQNPYTYSIEPCPRLADVVVAVVVEVVAVIAVVFVDVVAAIVAVG